jgi:hypothetical protein
MDRRDWRPYEDLSHDCDQFVVGMYWCELCDAKQTNQEWLCPTTGQEIEPNFIQDLQLCCSCLPPLPRCRSPFHGDKRQALRTQSHSMWAKVGSICCAEYEGAALLKFVDSISSGTIVGCLPRV